MPPILLGLAVMWRGMRQRPVSTANQPTLTQAPQAAQQGVVRAIVDIQDLTVGRLFDRRVHTDSGSAVATVSQGRQVQLGCGPIQRAQHVVSGGGQVVHRPGFDVSHPQWDTVGRGQGLDVAAGFVGLPGKPQVDLCALHACGLLAAPVGGEDLPAQDHIGHPSVLARRRASCRSGAWSASTAMTSSR